MDRINIAVKVEVEGANMGRTVGTTNAGLEIGVAIGTEAGLVAAGTSLLIAAGGQWVGDMEITGVAVNHVITERALLISKTGHMTLHTIALGMTGGAVHRLTFGHAAMVTSPHGAVGVDRTQFSHFRVGFIVAHQAGLGIGDNADGAVNVTGTTLHAGGILFHMGLVIKAHIRPNDRDADQE